MAIIESERFFMRPVTFDDLEALVALNSDPEVMRYINQGQGWPREKTVERLQHYLTHWRQHGFGVWVLERKTDSAFLGYCGLMYLEDTPEVEVGFRVPRECWGKGTATEAAKAALGFGFRQLGLTRIVAVVDPDNLASQRVIEKLGLRYEREAFHYGVRLNYYALNGDGYASAGDE